MSRHIKKLKFSLAVKWLNMIEIKHHTECECKETTIKVLVRFEPKEIFSHFPTEPQSPTPYKCSYAACTQRGRNKYMFYCSNFLQQSEHEYEKKLFGETPIPCPA